MKFILCSIFLFTFSLTTFAHSEEPACPSTLFYNVHHINYDMVHFLLVEQGLNPHSSSLESCREIFPEEMQRYPQGTTLAHVAMHRANPNLPWNKGASIFILLKEQGADMHIEDSTGRTAEDLYEIHRFVVENISGKKH